MTTDRHVIRLDQGISWSSYQLALDWAERRWGPSRSMLNPAGTWYAWFELPDGYLSLNGKLRVRGFFQVNTKEMLVELGLVRPWEWSEPGSVDGQ